MILWATCLLTSLTTIYERTVFGLFLLIVKTASESPQHIGAVQPDRNHTSTPSKAGITLFCLSQPGSTQLFPPSNAYRSYNSVPMRHGLRTNSCHLYRSTESFQKRQG